MPIRTFAPKYGVFSPLDLDLLQSVYAEATEDLTSVDDAMMTDIAGALLDAHQSGVRDRQELLGIASRALYRRTA